MFTFVNLSALGVVVAIGLMVAARRWATAATSAKQRKWKHAAAVCVTRAAVFAAIVVALTALIVEFEPRLITVGIIGGSISLLGIPVARLRKSRVGSYLLSAAVVGMGVIVFIALLDEDAKVVELHTGSLRGSLFSGFLTLGGFLLSLKTFIIVKMKEGVYDTEEYRKSIAQRRALRPGRSIPVFAPLDRLRVLLFWAIVSALLTSIAQITIGSFSRIYTVAFCFASAAFTLTVLAISLWLINANLQRWFHDLEEASKGPDAGQKKKDDG